MEDLSCSKLCLKALLISSLKHLYVFVCGIRVWINLLLIVCIYIIVSDMCLGREFNLKQDRMARAYFFSCTFFGFDMNF